MSSSAWTVIFFWLRRGPASLTILRRKLSPEASRKNVMKKTTASWPRKPNAPSVPVQRYSLMSRRGFSISTRVTPRGVAGSSADIGSTGLVSKAPFRDRAPCDAAAKPSDGAGVGAPKAGLLAAAPEAALDAAVELSSVSYTHLRAHETDSY